MSIFQLSILFVLSIALHVCAQVPRGVAPEAVNLYQGDTLTCDQGTKTLSKDRINDGYCDCKDGLDEPGTSACAQNTFYCANKGHEARYIPSQWVDDGICDCCDGSDEIKGCDDVCHVFLEEKERRLKELEEEAKKGREHKKTLTSALSNRIASLKNVQEEKAVLEEQKKKLTEEIQEARRKSWERVEPDTTTLLGQIQQWATPITKLAKDVYTRIFGTEVDRLTQKKKDLEKKLAEVSQEIATIDILSNLDFGPNDLYYNLFHKYEGFRAGRNKEYRVTFFKDVTLNNVNIGEWHGWDGNVMVYQRSGCDGGQRYETRIRFECGLTEEILGAESLDACHHEIVYKTPIAC